MNSTRLLIFGLFALFVVQTHACDAPPAAVVDLNVNSYYTDPHHSVIDPILKKKHDDAVAPLENFMKLVVKFADHGQGACTIEWLQSWAEHRALLGTMATEQAYYERKWMLAGLALTYAKTKSTANLKQQQSVLNWLVELAELTMQHSNGHRGARNNHYYWEGLAVGAVGAIAHQQQFQDWSIGVFNFAMGQIQEDGSLPYELDRGQRALHYHAFSAGPLMFIASIYNLHSPRLQLLQSFIFNNLKNPAEIERRTGFVQVPVPDNHLAWLEVSLRRHPDTALERFILPKRPLGSSKLGGNLSVPNPLETFPSLGLTQ